MYPYKMNKYYQKIKKYINIIKIMGYVEYLYKD